MATIEPSKTCTKKTEKNMTNLRMKFEPLLKLLNEQHFCSRNSPVGVQRGLTEPYWLEIPRVELYSFPVPSRLIMSTRCFFYLIIFFWQDFINHFQLFFEINYTKLSSANPMIPARTSLPFSAILLLTSSCMPSIAPKTDSAKF